MADDTQLSLAKALVKALEQGDTEASERLLDEIANTRESHLFKEVGKLTRQLHDSMGSFVLESRIAELAEHEIPDAKERLKYVITMTEQAANQTLGVVEDLLSVSEQFTAQSELLSGKWDKFRAREMPLDEFKTMSHELTQHFEETFTRLSKIQGGLNEILIAQSFQDITGQIIRKVIDLVKNLEENMVSIIRLSGNDKAHHAKVRDELPGPVVPGVDDTLGDIASNQDDVDDLLSSLGF